jgi:spermidine/putrescine-binding protein
VFNAKDRSLSQPRSDQDEQQRRRATRREFIERAGGTLLASSAVGGLVAACGSSSSSSAGAAAAKIGGQLSMLLWEGYDDPTASAAFRKQYNVSVRTDLLQTNTEIITKLLAGGGGQYSLVTPEIALTPLMVEAGVVDPVDWSQIASTQQYIPTIASFGKEFTVGGKTYGAPYQWGINAMIYNAKYLPTPPRSFMEFTKPAYRNKIALTDVAEDNYLLWGQLLGYDPLHMTSSELTKVTNFVINLKKTNVRVFSNDYDALAQALAAGDVIACASPLNTSLPALARKHGSDTVKYYLPPGGESRTWTDSWALPKGGSNRATAYAWINYMLSAKANAQVATDNQYATVNAEGVPLVRGVARTAYPYAHAAELARLAPAWAVPRGTSGTVTWQDWSNAWKNVEAA